MLTRRRRYRFWLLLLMLLMVGTVMLLLRYERYTITTLRRRRDGLIFLVVAVSHRIHNWIICIARRRHLIEPRISPISDRRHTRGHRARTPLAAGV